MKRLFLVLGTAFVILPWLAGAKAQADAIQWSESVTLLEPTPNSNGVASINPENRVAALLGLSPGKASDGTNSGSVVALEVGHSADPDRMSTPTFGGPSANYSLSLALNDDASGASGSLTFRGNLNGWINSDNSVSLTNTFLGPTTQSLMLGGNLYTATIGPFDNPPSRGPDLGQLPATISASISVQPAAVQSAPEPSSLVLACLGLPSLGLARWFLRRKIIDGAVSQA